MAIRGDNRWPFAGRTTGRPWGVSHGRRQARSSICLYDFSVVALGVTTSPVVTPRIGNMGSLGTGEILVIVLVILIVFGPDRLPELTRKAGELLSKARTMSRSFTDDLDAEYGDIASPIKELKGDYDASMNQMKDVASSLLDFSVDPPTTETKTDSDGDADTDQSDPTHGPRPSQSDEETS